MPDESGIDVVILTPERMIFEGRAKTLVLPGEKGMFEIQPFHKKLLSRLVRGVVTLDGESLPIRRGVAKVGQNRVTVIIEEP